MKAPSPGKPESPSKKSEGGGDGDDDDDWETKDDADLVIVEKPPEAPKVPPGMGVSLRPGGAMGAGAFSSATKTVPGASASGKKCNPALSLSIFLRSTPAFIRT